jgi:sugar/nucleoside kinase (ribokinase family)
MSTNVDLITIGSAIWDSIIPNDETILLEEAGNRYLAYPYGKKLYLEQAYFGFGGGASNVAVSAARLGLKVSFIGAIGQGRVGESVLENFADEGVGTKMVKRDTEHQTGKSVVLTAPDGERTILLYHGANNYLTDADIPWEDCKKTKWLYVSSLSGESDTLYTKVAETAAHNGVKLALNPGSTQIKRGTKGMHAALEHCNVLLLNDDEARELLRQRGKAGETVKEMLTTLQGISQGCVAITKGDKGAEAFDGTQFYDLGIFTQNRVNALGAGDAFGSTLVASMIKAVPFADALRFASINAASVVSDFGAQSALLEWDELNRRAGDAAKFQPKITKA